VEELQEYFVEVLTQCTDNGMALPFIVCAISTNGSVLVVRINGGHGPDTTLAQHFEDDVFKMPMNIVVVDRLGEAVRVVIEGGKINYQ
jgi:hypothetical protein